MPANSPASPSVPPPAAAHIGSTAQTRGAGVRVEVEVADLARPPSPAELRAIRAAVELALGAAPAIRAAKPGPWRFAGRWWDTGSGGPRGQWVARAPEDRSQA